MASDVRLVDAVEKQDKDAVAALLRQHADVNARQPDGATALHWAVHWNDLAMVDSLIRAGANVNAANELGATSLYLACRQANAAIVQKLLEAGANPNSALPGGETALMTAAATGNVEAAKALLDHGADRNAQERDRGQTALMWAASEKHPEMVRLLIERHADVNARSKGGFTPLLFAARAGDVESARLLLAAGANLNDTAPDGSSPLVVASASVVAIASKDYKLNVSPSDHEKLALFLLERGADPSRTDGFGHTALHVAVETGKVELVKALLAHGANPNARMIKDEPPLAGDYAARPGFVGATPFWVAARASDLNLMRILAAAGANPNLPDRDNVTPLMVAIGAAQTENRLPPESQVLDAVKLCFELGNNVNAAGRNGQTALHAAAAMGEDSVIQFLFDHGAKLDAKDRLGHTALDVALTNPSRPRPKTAALLRKLAAQGSASAQ
ncbi:MAG TPA: ankyrin repeat domain-containing protein [Bryobacteraceae bacterium]|nr:ankyrin repeat domain-containing protein [Bryobacteraceae bacterium]